MKEVWRVPRPLDRVIHTLGWPLRARKRYHEFGGSFIYPMGPEHVSLGFVAGLDAADATLSVHDLLQELKTHPLVRRILEGGERVAWGAKAIPEGGFWSLPASVSPPGAVICGDAAGFVNVPKLKGVHYALRSGMLAAETIYQALQRPQADLAAARSARPLRLAGSRERDLVRPASRAQHAPGVPAGPRGRRSARRGDGRHARRAAARALPLRAPTPSAASFDGERRYPAPERRADVRQALERASSRATARATTSPTTSASRATSRASSASAWASMCPAHVYEVPDETDADGHVELQVTPSNCVQCGAITAKGGRLTPPEGGSGPEYTVT